jgi:hypothetical protein
MKGSAATGCGARLSAGQPSRAGSIINAIASTLASDPVKAAAATRDDLTGSDRRVVLHRIGNLGCDRGPSGGVSLYY